MLLKEAAVDQSFKEQLEELQKQARLADTIDKERADLFQGLVNHPGWVVYQELLNIRVQMYADAIMAPAGSVDGAIALEWVKGAMSGVILARDLPSVTINAMQPAVPATDGEE
jgi:hypothetical protein